MSEVPHPDELPLQEVRGRRGAEQDGGVPAVRVASLVQNATTVTNGGSKH